MEELIVGAINYYPLCPSLEAILVLYWGKSTRDELLSKLEHLLIPGRNPSSIISARLARVARVALYRDVF